MPDNTLIRPVIFAESRLTARSQTTIPATIRDALGLKAGETLHYQLLPGGEVRLSRMQNEDDPVMASFLSFLEQDMQKNPQSLKPFSADLFDRIDALTAGMEVDLDGPLTEG